MNIKKDILFRVTLMFGVMVVFSIAIIGRTIFLQTVRGDKWRAKADQRYVRERQIPARRGNIYADDGSLLATSITKYKLSLDPRVPKKDSNNIRLYRDSVGYFCKSLSRILNEGHDSTFYRNMIRTAVLNKEAYLSLTNKIIEYDTRKEIEKLPWAKKGKYRSGIMFDTLNIRYNPFGTLARRTIGFKKEKDKAGLEFSFDRQLAGTAGQGVFEKIAGGSWRPVDDTEEAYPTPGLDLYTTLSIGIQDVAETALRKKLIEFRADKGCVVVMEVATGEIKAMANMSKQRNGSYEEDYNHAVRGRTDPGSTFKLASMMALLEEGLDPNERVETSNGRFMVYGVPVVDTKAHGNISAQEVMEQSSNVGVARLMWKYFEGKKENYYNYLRKYHLTEPLSFQIRSPEDFPKIRDVNQWDRVSMYSISRGYESGFTPLQILAFYNAVANGGRWVQPIIVKQSKDADEMKEDFTVSQLKVTEPFCDETVLKKAQRMLEGVVENGTATILKNADYKIAGKTGTAQRYVRGRGYIKDSLLYTSFVGYFPANEPRYSCIVMIDNPHSNTGLASLYAGKAAAPVFKEIADRIFANDVRMHKPMPLMPSDSQMVAIRGLTTKAQDLKKITETLLIPQKPTQENGWTVAVLDDKKKLAWQNRELDKGKGRNQVPNVKGMSLRDALFILGNKGFKVTHQGIGKVKEQSLNAGAVAQRNKAIHLVLG